MQDLKNISVMVVFNDKDGNRMTDVTELAFNWPESLWIQLARQASLIPTKNEQVIRVMISGTDSDGERVLRSYPLSEIEAARRRTKNA